MTSNRLALVATLLIASGTALAGPEAKPAPAKETVTKTGALDLDLAESGGKFTLRDSAYQITFPGKPTVEGADQMAPSGVKLKTGSALYAATKDVYGFFIIPIPKGVPYDVEKGITGARDGALNNVGGKVTKEDKTKLGGIEGRRTYATADFQGSKMNVVLFVAWDAKHRTLVAMFTATQDLTSKPEEAFFASFKLNPAGAAPPAGDGK